MEEGLLDGLFVFVSHGVLLGFTEQEACLRCEKVYYPHNNGKDSYIGDGYCPACVHTMHSRMKNLRTSNKCPVDTQEYIFGVRKNRSRRVYRR